MSDLIISDTPMPGLDGLGLYREVQRRFPALRERMVFVTTGAPVVLKPFDVEEVRCLVHQVCAGVQPLSPVRR